MKCRRGCWGTVPLILGAEGEKRSIARQDSRHRTLDLAKACLERARVRVRWIYAQTISVARVLLMRSVFRLRPRSWDVTTRTLRIFMFALARDLVSISPRKEAELVDRNTHFDVQLAAVTSSIGYESRCARYKFDWRSFITPGVKLLVLSARWFPFADSTGPARSSSQTTGSSNVALIPKP